MPGRSIRASTAALKTGAFRALYILVSGYLDMGIAAAGKTTPAAENFRRIRSRLRMPRGEDEAATTEEPNPEAPQ